MATLWRQCWDEFQERNTQLLLKTHTTTVTSVTHTHIHNHADLIINNTYIAHTQSSVCTLNFTHMLSCATNFSLGYSVAVGEFTGDSEQGEKANSSLQLTTYSTRGIPHCTNDINSHPATPSKILACLQPQRCLYTLKSGPQEDCEGCDGVSDREWTAGWQCLGLNSEVVMRTVSVCLGHDPEGTGLREALIKGFPLRHFWLIRMISGRLHRPLQVSSWSRVSSGHEILGGKRGRHATWHRVIKNMQVGKSAFEFIFKLFVKWILQE